MKKKFCAFLCLLGLVKYSNGMDKTISLSKKIGIGLTLAAAANVCLHLLTRPFLYKGLWTKPANRKNLPNKETQKWENHKLNNGGNAVIREPSNNSDIKSIWICFPGHKYDGINAIERLLADLSNNNDDFFKSVFVGIDYPGYSKGEWKWPNSSRLTKIANEIVDYVHMKWPNAKINIYARSLGGYPASSIMNRDEIDAFYLRSPIRLDKIAGKILTYVLNWENLSYIDNIFKKIPERKTRCNVTIVSGERKDSLSLYDTLSPKDGKEIKEKLIDTGKLNLQCKIDKKADHSCPINFFDPNLKTYDILTGKAEGD